MGADTLWEQIGQQGALFAFMALVIMGAAWYIKHQIEAQERRETEREDRYNELVDKVIDMSEKQTGTVTEALVGNTEVLRRVERKLDGTH